MNNGTAAMSESTAQAGIKVRGLMRRAARASLATALARDGSAWPYASLVLVAVDHDSGPLLLLSDLADHSRNIAADPRVALLFDGTAGWTDPLAGPRASVLGRIQRADQPHLIARFNARHPGAALYADFKDFHLYRVAVERAHLVAGFGEIHWLAGEDVLFDAGAAAPLAAAEPEIVAHMNRDHGPAVAAIACRLLGLQGDGWTMIAIDPEGADLSNGADRARVEFDEPVRDGQSARAELVRLTERARESAPGPSG
jgi:putative heme iron utilization protein